MIRKIFAPLALISLLTIAGCNIINPSELTPTYVHVDSFTVRSNPNNSVLGTLSHKITHVWAYLDGTPLGAFDLPATFPVRVSAPGTLTLLPGIDFDGLRGYEAIYLLYTSDTLRLNPQPGATVTHNPTTMYANNVKMEFNADFENGSSNGFQRLSGDTDLVTTKAPGEVFEGVGSGVINLNAAQDSALVISSQSLTIPAGTEAYLEVNYKGTMSLTVGMTSTLTSGNTYSQYLIALKPRDNWGKAYIGIKEFVSGNQGTGYHILIGARKQSDTAASGQLFLDNIKVVSL